MNLDEKKEILEIIDQAVNDQDIKSTNFALLDAAAWIQRRAEYAVGSNRCKWRRIRSHRDFLLLKLGHETEDFEELWIRG